MHLQRTVRIDAPPETVWRCLTDAELRPRWLRDLVSEEPDDPDRRGVGAAATVRLRQNGEVVTYRSTVVEWEDGRRLGVGMTGGKFPPDAALGVLYDLSSGDTAASTTLDYHMQFSITRWYLKLLSPLVRMGAGKAADGILGDLKALAESLTNRTSEG